MPNMQNYDEASIDLCGNFAEDFFKNFEQYRNQYKPDVLFSDISFDMLKRRNALDNYILKNYSKLDENNPVDVEIKKNMDKYLQGFYKRFISNPTELLGSPFLKGPKTVERFCPEMAKKKDGSIGELRKKVIETYKQNTKDPKALYIIDRNSDSLGREDTDRLMHSLINSIGTDNKEVQNYQQEYLKKLITNRSRASNLTPRQVEFVAKYINNLMITSRLKELGYNREDIQTNIYIGTDRKEHGGFEIGNSIYINKDSVLTMDIPSLIQVVCHETEHSIQELESKKNPKSKIGLDLAICNALRNYYSSEKGYDVYHNNYRFEQIEQDAENIGHNYARTYLDVLGFKDEARKISEIKTKKADARRFEYDYRTDENGKKCTREEFFYNSLNSAVSRKPDLVKKYPALSILYSQDGKVKSFDELISGEFKLNEDDKSQIPEDFCKYYISKGMLDNFELSKFPKNVQANIASRLITILKGENIQIGTMGREQQYYQRDVAEKDKIGVESFHLKNARNIMRFMNKNYQYFRELQDKGIFSSIIDMDSYDDAIGIFKNDSTYENLAFNKPENIETVKQLALDAVENKNVYRANKKGQTTFNPNALETSFNTLVSESRLSGFQQATQTIKTLPRDAVLQNEQEVEEK